MNKFSNNIGVTSKFQMLEGLTCWRFVAEDSPYQMQFPRPSSAYNLCTCGIRCSQQCYLSIECATSTRIHFQRNRSFAVRCVLRFLRISPCGSFHFRIEFSNWLVLQAVYRNPLTGDRPITGMPTQNTGIKKAYIMRILPILNHLKSVFTQSFPVSLR